MKNPRSLDQFLRQALVPEPPAYVHPDWVCQKDTGLWGQCVAFLSARQTPEPEDVLTDILTKGGATLASIQGILLDNGTLAHPPSETLKRCFYLRRLLVWKATRQQSQKATADRACLRASRHCKGSAGPDTAALHAGQATAKEALTRIPDQHKFRFLRHLLETFHSTDQILSTMEIANHFGITPQGAIRPLKETAAWFKASQKDLADLREFRTLLLEGAA